MGYQFKHVKTNGAPFEMIKAITNGFEVENFVETGTAGGDTILEAAKIYKNSHSIELIEGRLLESVKKEIKYKKLNPNLHIGYSTAILPDIIRELEGYAIFWLDAHYSDPTASTDDVEECPVLEEIRILANYKKAIIIIDDARLFLGAPPEPLNADKWANIQQIFKHLNVYFPYNLSTIVDDYVICIPNEMKENFDKYWQKGYNERYPDFTKFDWKRDCLNMYINLGHRTDRRDRMENELSKVNLSAERIDGMYYDQYAGDRNIIQKMLSKSQGAVGCFFSHVKAMEKALHEGKSAFIMEDDLVLASDIQKRLDYAQYFLNNHPDWDILWLGGTYHLDPPRWHCEGHNPDLQDCGCDLKKDVEITEDPRIVRTYGIWSTYAYIINHRSLGKILNMIEKNTANSYAIDHLFIKLQPNLKTYAFVPAMAKQYDNQSNIQKGVMQFSLFAELGAYWWADKMTDVDPLSIEWEKPKKEEDADRV